jgi:hypothetical protein
LAIFLDLIGDSVPIFIGTPKFNHSRKRTFGAAKVGIFSLFSNYFGFKAAKSAFLRLYAQKKPPKFLFGVFLRLMAQETMRLGVQINKCLVLK